MATILNEGALVTEKKTFRKASLQQVRQAGIYFSVAELNKRGVSATPVKKKSKIVIIADNHDKSRSITLRVKSKRSRVWQSSIMDGQPMMPKSDESNFWVFVSLGNYDEHPKFWVVPNWWIKNDIYLAHQEYLKKHGGTRPVTPDSTHHSIDESRLSEWQDRWDILDIFN
ncbi:MAG: hypothetical protein LC101_03535 [Flavobacteriales bacterium]|nr:hypothetical protein [Flavobacteriales bacterium]